VRPAGIFMHQESKWVRPAGNPRKGCGRAPQLSPPPFRSGQPFGGGAQPNGGVNRVRANGLATLPPSRS